MPLLSGHVPAECQVCWRVETGPVELPLLPLRGKQLEWAPVRTVDSLRGQSACPAVSPTHLEASGVGRGQSTCWASLNHHNSGVLAVFLRVWAPQSFCDAGTSDSGVGGWGVSHEPGAPSPFPGTRSPPSCGLPAALDFCHSGPRVRKDCVWETVV